MQITYTRGEYYNSLGEIMNLIKFVGDFEVTEQDEDNLVLEFPDNYAGIAEYYLTFPMDDLAEGLANASLHKKADDTKKLVPETKDISSIIDELKNLNETIKAASGYKISTPKTCRCSTAETNPQARATRRAAGLNKAE